MAQGASILTAASMQGRDVCSWQHVLGKSVQRCQLPGALLALDCGTCAFALIPCACALYLCCGYACCALACIVAVLQKRVCTPLERSMQWELPHQARQSPHLVVNVLKNNMLLISNFLLLRRCYPDDREVAKECREACCCHDHARQDSRPLQTEVGRC